MNVDTAVEPFITLTAAEYEALRASTRPMVTITQDEYDQLKAKGPEDSEELKRVRGMLQLTQARLREVETLLSREQMEHQSEYNALMAEYQKLRGGR